MNIFLENKMLESMFLFEHDDNIEQKLLSSELIEKLKSKFNDNFNSVGGNCAEVSNYIISKYPDTELQIQEKFVLYPYDKDTDEAVSIYSTSGHTVVQYKDKLYDYTNQQYAEFNDTYPNSLKNKIPVIFTKISENKYSSEQQQDENENIVLIIETK